MPTIRGRLSVGLVILAVVVGLRDPLDAYAGNAVWTTSGPFGDLVRVIVPAPDNADRVLVALDSDGVVRSDDGGQTWSGSSVGLVSSLGVHSIAFDPVNPVVVYASQGQRSPTGGVYKSADQGATWSATASTRPLASVVTSATESGFFAGADGSPAAEAIYRSTDGGASWTTSTGAMPAGATSSHAPSTTASATRPAPCPPL